jgi:hypothetical protein
MRVTTDKKKTQWLLRYDTVVKKRLKGCKKTPTWQHYPAGHMRLAQGFTPEKAATAYLAETYWIKKCAKKRKAKA